MKIRIFPNLEICNTYFQIWLILFKLCLSCQNASKGEYKSVESRNHPKTFAGNGRSNTAFTVCQRNGNSAFDAQPRVQLNGCFKFGTSGKDSSPFRHFRGVAVGFGRRNFDGTADSRFCILRRCTRLVCGRKVFQNSADSGFFCQ